jgi:acyl carrier protein
LYALSHANIIDVLTNGTVINAYKGIIMHQEIKSRVIDVIAKSLQIPKDSIQLDQTIQSLCPHSLDIVTLLFDFEDEFNISISDEEAKQLKTVQDIIVGIEKLQEKNKTDTVAST